MSVFERFRALDTVRQLMLIGITSAVLASLIFALWFSLLRISYETLFRDLRPADAATIVAELERRKIDYRLRDGGATIEVPAEKVDSTRLDVMTDDLPLKGTVGFELFNKSDFGLTDFAQKINYQRALQGELERTIMSLDGVETARVHLSLGEDRLFREDRVLPKASVTIRMKRGISLSIVAAQGITHLIAAAVPKLDSENVVIVDERGELVGVAQSSADGSDGLTAQTPNMQETAAIERFYEARIRNALEKAFPLNAIAVRVSATALSEGQASDADNWSPNARDFPLAITLSPELPLDKAAQQAARNLVAAVIGYTEGSDAIDFAETAGPYRAIDASPLSPAPRRRDLAAAPGGPADDGADEKFPFEELGFAGLPLLALAAFAFLLRRARAPKRLSASEREAFTRKLRALLVEEGSHAQG